MLIQQRFLLLLISLSLSACSALSPVRSSTSFTTMQNQQQAYLTADVNHYNQFAEINDYPNPTQVLKLAEQLHLSSEQVTHCQAIYDEMHKYDEELSEQYKSKQRVMNQLYVSGRINEDSLALILTQLSILESKIRYVHLNAHLKQKAVLNTEQVDLYHQLMRAVDENQLH